MPWSGLVPSGPAIGHDAIVSLIPPTSTVRDARPRYHWHRFRWVGEDAFSGASLYACRGGVMRPAL